MTTEKDQAPRFFSLGPCFVLSSLDEVLAAGEDLLGNDGEWFGTSVKLSDDGDMLVVGSWKQPGTVRVFRWAENVWQKVGTTIYGDRNTWWETLGYAVDISGDGRTIVAGNPHYRARLTGQA